MNEMGREGGGGRGGRERMKISFSIPSPYGAGAPYRITLHNLKVK